MIHPICACLLGYIFVCGRIIQTQASCPHPDVPANGNYTPKQRKFEPGDEILLSCQKGFALWGKERRVCKSNGLWSDHSPFCDHAVNLDNPSVEGEKFALPLVERVIDGNIKTCFEWVNPIGKHMYVHLDKKIVIRTLKLNLKKGSVGIQILTGLNNDMKLCGDHRSLLETDQWIIIKCRNNNVVADTMKILVTESSTLTICEIEAYGKAEDGCDHSPSRKVLNGHFEVSRSKAVLICSEGYRSENSNRLVCEGNSWVGDRLKCEEMLCDPIISKRQLGVEWTFPDTTKKLSVGTRSTLRCKKGYRKVGGHDSVVCQKNGTWTKTDATCVEEGNSNQKIRGIILGIVAVIVILVIVALLAAIICFVRKQKKKEVVVVFQQQSAESFVPESDGQYEVPCYENIPNESLKGVPPEPPSTPRPLAKLSTMSRGGDATSSTSWKRAVPKNTFNTDQNFQSMKPSTLYGS